MRLIGTVLFKRSPRSIVVWLVAARTFRVLAVILIGLMCGSCFAVYPTMQPDKSALKRQLGAQPGFWCLYASRASGCRRTKKQCKKLASGFGGFCQYQTRAAVYTVLVRVTGTTRTAVYPNMRQCKMAARSDNSLENRDDYSNVSSCMAWPPKTRLRKRGKRTSATQSSAPSKDLCVAECKSDGQCHRIKQKCVAIYNHDCQKSERCGLLGGCSASNGRCIAGSNADCEQSTGCTTNGYCVAVGGACRFKTTTDVDCNRKHIYGARSVDSPCKSMGECRAINGACIPSSDADCRQSTLCTMTGRCVLDGSNCVAGLSQDCAKSDGCNLTGACSVVNGSCSAKTDADCQQSVICSGGGFCFYRNGTCVKEGAK